MIMGWSQMCAMDFYFEGPDRLCIWQEGWFFSLCISDYLPQQAVDALLR